MPGDIHDMEHDPHWVDRVLNWRGTWPLARVALCGLFIVTAVLGLFDFPNAVAVQEQAGFHPGALWAGLTIAVQVIGATLVVSGRWVWLGAGMLAVFTALTNVLVHHFWTMEGVARFAARNEFFEHIGLISGFVMASLIADQKARALSTQGKSRAAN